ncbi:hypothetical protein [Lentzea nigeriaca]|uniref:hypothetical protein n=1 Tax=Lentzea nigeriaca TaxID=1128665 RepID=UPI00195F0EB4|nr:hypothetical protein [Lentzea nigeriaca]MBM7857108.1 hypothetical protein [Lentzea nigeriaca]
MSRPHLVPGQVGPPELRVLNGRWHRDARAKKHGTIGADARVKHDVGVDTCTSAIARTAELLTDANERAVRLALAGAALTR